MAAPVTLTASFPEGQLLQLIEQMTNIQLIAQANGWINLDSTRSKSIDCTIKSTNSALNGLRKQFSVILGSNFKFRSNYGCSNTWDKCNN